MGYILVTNDDGIESPALRPLLHELAKLSEVRAVVPDRERSWISKAITRWQKLRVEVIREGALEIHTLDGFPADCTQLGVHALFDEPPDLVVSGINIGLNYGLGFFLSSGTVGAAIEGWIAGVPAVAFSLGDPSDDRSWKDRVTQPDWKERWACAARVCASLVEELRRSYPEGVDLLNVNLPIQVAEDTPRSITYLATVGYEQLFHADGEGSFSYGYRGGMISRAPLEGTDIAAVRNGLISITPVRLAHSVALSAESARRLASPGTG